VNNPFDSLLEAIKLSEDLRRAVNNHADRMARLLVGSLRNISPSVCEQLKRELADFNMQTHKWKRK
jgi:hypothetical protein